jgi:hypothetical protein
VKRSVLLAGLLLDLVVEREGYREGWSVVECGMRSVKDGVFTVL